MPTKPHLAIVSADSSLPIADLADPQTGPLAEAEALADVLNILTTDQSQARPDSMAILSRMLVERLDAVRGVVEVAAKVGAA